jgi:hypothetical protein
MGQAQLSEHGMKRTSCRVRARLGEVVLANEGRMMDLDYQSRNIRNVRILRRESSLLENISAVSYKASTAIDASSSSLSFRCTVTRLHSLIVTNLKQAQEIPVSFPECNSLWPNNPQSMNNVTPELEPNHVVQKTIGIPINWCNLRTRLETMHKLVLLVCFSKTRFIFDAYP